MPKTTIQTAIAIANSLIGSAAIILPLNYLNYGIIQNIIFLILLGTLLAITCSVYAMHLRPSESEITQVIKRILGENYFKFGTFLSGINLILQILMAKFIGIMLLLVSCVFFLLPADILYDVFLDLFGQQFFLSEKVFKLILVLLFSFLTLFPNLNNVLKYAPLAMAALIISTSTLLISFPFNISNIDIGVIQPKQFSLSNLLLVASINSFSFTCHPSISPMLKQHQNKKNNKKAVYLGFGISATLYLIVGVCGVLTIYGKHPKRTNNVLDYFQGEWQAPVMGFSNFIYFLFIFPIFPYIVKTQLTSLLPQSIKQHTKFSFYRMILFVLVFMGLASFFILTETSPGKVLGFIGSVVAFYFTYLTPVLIMYKAGKTQYISQNQPIQNQQQDNKSPIQYKRDKQSLLTQGSSINIKQPLISSSTQPTSYFSSQQQLTKIIKDQKYLIKHKPLNILDKIIYGFILFVGLVLFVAELVDIVKGFIN